MREVDVCCCSVDIGCIVFEPKRSTGHTMPTLHGLTGGHVHECITMLGSGSIGAAAIGVCRRRMVRMDVGVVLIPMLTACRKLAMRLFCGGKKEVDHSETDMVQGCQFVF
jgi:hypothetical protein